MFCYFVSLYSHPEAAVAYSWPRAESFMRTARRRAVPPVPSTLSDLGNILRFQNFGNRYSCHAARLCKAIIDDGNNGVSLVFYCDELIGILVAEGITEVHADATFKVVPAAPSCRQLFVVHCIYGDHVSTAAF